MNKGPTSL